jgi:hypothetical protein
MDTNTEVKKADVFGDTITEGTPIDADRKITVNLSRVFAIKLGKSIAKNKCETIADAVKSKDSFVFLKSLHIAGIDYKEMELHDDVANFLEAYL